MVAKSRSCLIGLGLFAMWLSCRHQEVLPPVGRSTDRIVRIVEWYGNTGSDSRYTYDPQGRLATQTTESYRDGEYGHEVVRQRYTFTYTPNSLGITRSDSGRTGSGHFVSAPLTVALPLNEQGLVMYTTDLLERTYWISNGVSSLFRDAVAPLYGDTLRTYDADGHLLKTNYAFSQLGDELHIVHNLTSGNIDRTDHVSFSGNPYNKALATQKTTLYHHLYDTSKPGLLNPHQFLGRTNRNLIVKTSQTEPVGGNVYQTAYAYDYDARNRVKRYTITSQYDTVIGDVYYSTP